MICKSVKFRGHPCFKNSWSGFDEFRPINVIIGRNNTGKSHLLDLVEHCCKRLEALQSCEFLGSGVLDQDSIIAAFPPQHHQSNLPGDLWENHGSYLVGEEFTVKYGGNAENPISFDLLGGVQAWAKGLHGSIGAHIEARKQRCLSELATLRNTILTDRFFRALRADRDIRSEAPRPDLDLRPDGSGATNMIRRYLTGADLQRDLVHHDLLAALNEIFGSDGNFTEIEVKFHELQTPSNQPLNTWEVYLGQKHKGLVPLSRSGSGLKTVILVLLNLLVVPAVRNHSKKSYVFAFEELENNLHPALLRRLLTYIERYALEHTAHVFLTTHSSAALDTFGQAPHAQIIRVVHDGESARSESAVTHFDHRGIISELGAKPSDLLQANGVVWVEGPSDRIYLNRWIELASGGRFKEGRDYVCAFYGGALLANDQFASPDEANPQLSNLLRVNANIVVVCDSDRTADGEQGAELKGRVGRIATEVSKIPDGHVWITETKEVENYLPANVLRNIFKNEEISAPDARERFFPTATGEAQSYLEKQIGRKTFDKVKLATLV